MKLNKIKKYFELFFSNIKNNIYNFKEIFVYLIAVRLFFNLKNF